MPIHDWTRVAPGGFHNFHQDWSIEIDRALNRGVLPPGYVAYNELRIGGWEPDAVAIGEGNPASPGGKAVDLAPPRARQSARVESEAASYARRANRVVIRHEFGRIVAVIELVSPGNKDSRHAARQFVGKAVDLLRAGVNLLLIDLFPPTPRDPEGLDRLIWDELSAVPFPPRPPDRPQTVAGYDADAGAGLVAYVDPLSVGEPLPDGPLFLAPGRYVDVPLEATYQSAWDVTPPPLRALVAPASP